MDLPSKEFAMNRFSSWVGHLEGVLSTLVVLLVEKFEGLSQDQAAVGVGVGRRARHTAVVRTSAIALQSLSPS